MFSKKLKTSLLTLFCTLALLVTSFLIPEQLSAQEDFSSKSWAAFDEHFDVSDVGNLHIYSPTDAQNNPDFTFYGTPLDRGLYGLFSSNWRKDLPEDFKTYALYKIRHGSDDAYIMRFAGTGTQNMIALFTKKGDKLVFLRNLSTYYCGYSSCWQMDSWIQDFDGDTRLDILQKARVEQFTLMGAPVDEYTQTLRQQRDGSYYPTSEFEINLDDYNFKSSDEK